jgi:cell wall assembly regulator SMI1
MDAVDEITRARSLDLIDRDGDRVDLVVHPAAAPAQIEALEKQLGLTLPRELRALLAHTAGIDGILDVLDFTGRDVSFEYEDIFPAGHPIAHDGYGSHWVVDITPGERDVAPCSSRATTRPWSSFRARISGTSRARCSAW